MTRWTEEQTRAIEARGRNILLSAAAGSGKTTVLVERVLRLVTEDGADVDRMLVVTFTRAAASEMKERIGRAIEARLAVDPENAHLQRQVTLLHTAQITTIDSFCTWLLRNSFSTDKVCHDVCIFPLLEDELPGIVIMSNIRMVQTL